ncbi:MAG: hypothetical protein OEZ32_10250 [Nitrospinota bacterium]|nr:hypothetical protein [Nitrospinota bacterium]
MKKKNNKPNSRREELTEREARVLAAVAEISIKKAEPVGAGTLAGGKGLDLCPASIRNTMASLEREGYLVQPHASAGREPTDKGYGYYARRLARTPRLPRQCVKLINEVVDDPAQPETATRLDALSRALSTISRQVGLAGLNSTGSAPIREYSFMRLGDDRLGAVMATMSGELLRGAVKPGWDVSGGKPERMSAFFNDRFSYMTVPQARRLLDRQTKTTTGADAVFAQEAYHLALALEEGLAVGHSKKIYIEGVANLYQHVDGEDDIRAIMALGAAMGESGNLTALIDGLAKGEGETVMVGSQSMIDGFSECSVVAHSFAGPHGLEGAIGVIGKKRMDYGFAIALVSLAARSLTVSLGGAGKWS